MKVLCLTNIPSPYRVQFFNELGKKCELTVLFERRFSDERDDSWKKYNFNNFRGIFMSGISFGPNKAISIDFRKEICAHRKENIIVMNPATPTGILSIVYMKMKGIPFYIESDGAIPNDNHDFKEWLKTCLFKNAKGYFSSSKMSDQYFLKYGAEKERIYRYPFTSLSKSDVEAYLKFEKEDKIVAREHIKANENRIVLTVGRFSYQAGYGKGFDTIMNAAEQCSDVGFYIVGDEPTSEFSNWKEEKKLNNVHFVGFKEKEELNYYYLAADIFVLMTRSDVWGLVINEAMLFSLPIITTEKCVAGLELVEDGKNGFVIGVSDYSTLVEKVKYLMGDQNIRTEFGKESLNKIQKYTVENMSEAHYQILNRGGGICKTIL